MATEDETRAELSAIAVVLNDLRRRAEAINADMVAFLIAHAMDEAVDQASDRD